MVAATHLEEVSHLGVTLSREDSVAATGSPSQTRLTQLRRMITELAECARLDTVADAADDPAAMIDVVAALQAMRSVVAAAQATELVRFARARVRGSIADAQRDSADFNPRAVHRSIVDELALACRMSPHAAAQRLTAARTWTSDLPETFAALRAGEWSERVAMAVVNESRHLDAGQRQQLDAELAQAGLEKLGPVAAERIIRSRAYEVDRAGFVARGRHERKHRRVSLRPAPDTMSVLSGYLPVEQGVACLASLRQQADRIKAAGDERSRDQIMADTLVERITGQAAAEDVNVEIQILMPVESLTDPEHPAVPIVSGHGPLPMGIVSDILRDSRGRACWRRLFTRPTCGTERTIVGADRRRRFFDGHLRMLITARDQCCRMPFCDAPIRHVDHIQSWASGGETTLGNGQGFCERHNLTKEAAGWAMRREGPTRITVTTPTGHLYVTDDPDPP